MNLNFSRSSFPYGVLAGTASIAAIVFAQSAAFAAKSPQEIAKLANTLTVQVNPSPNDPAQRSGSGFIIARKGNTYTVLTCDHVLQGKPATIRTSDGKSYSITNGQSLGTTSNGIDLALLTFSSSIDYQVSTLGNSEQAAVGSQIFVFGYPVNKLERKVGEARNFEFSPGYITSRPSTVSGGYAMRYTAVTQPGMSGGPVFDIDGRVVGIHGRGENDSATIVNYQGGQISSTNVGLQVATKTGFNAAIPVNTFLSMQKQTRLEGVNVNKAPSTDKPAERIQNPQTAAEFAGRAQIRQERGDKSAAIDDYTQAIRLDPSYSNAYYRRAIGRYDQGDKQGAIADYNEAIRLNPNNAIAYFNRGVALYNVGNYQDAIADFSQSISFDPNDISAYYARGVARRNLKDGRGMFEDFDQIVRLAPNNAKTYFNRALARATLLDREGTVSDFTEAIRLDPRYTEAYINRAQVRRRLGDREGSIQDLTIALQIQPDNGIAYYTRGLFRRDLGDRQGALADLQAALTLFQQKGDTRSYQKAIEVMQRLQKSAGATGSNPGSNIEQPSSGDAPDGFVGPI